MAMFDCYAVIGAIRVKSESTMIDGQDLLVCEWDVVYSVWERLALAGLLCFCLSLWRVSVHSHHATECWEKD